MSEDDIIRKRIRRAAAAGRISMASQEGIEAFGPFAHEFVSEVFNVHACLISDESELTDMAEMVGTREERLERVYRRIEHVYGVDVRPLTNILEVLRKLDAERRREDH